MSTSDLESDEPGTSLVPSCFGIPVGVEKCSDDIKRALTNSCVGHLALVVENMVLGGTLTVAAQQLSPASGTAADIIAIHFDDTGSPIGWTTFGSPERDVAFDAARTKTGSLVATGWTHGTSIDYGLGPLTGPAGPTDAIVFQLEPCF